MGSFKGKGMKSVIIIFIIAIVLGVIGFIWINIEVNNMLEQTNNQVVEPGDVLPVKK